MPRISFRISDSFLRGAGWQHGKDLAPEKLDGEVRRGAVGVFRHAVDQGLREIKASGGKLGPKLRPRAEPDQVLAAKAATQSPRRDSAGIIISRRLGGKGSVPIGRAPLATRQTSRRETSRRSPECRRRIRRSDRSPSRRESRPAPRSPLRQERGKSRIPNAGRRATKSSLRTGRRPIRSANGRRAASVESRHRPGAKPAEQECLAVASRERISKLASCRNHQHGEITPRPPERRPS